MEKLKKIEIGGKQMPIRCNIDCLIAIQDEFDDFRTVEAGIIGISQGEDGKPKYSTPKLKMIKFILPIFIRNGIKEAAKQGETVPELELNEAIDNVDFNIIEIALALYEEFQRCFYRKKSTAQKNTKLTSTEKKKAEK